MADSDIELHEGEEVVRRTIVGGRPRRRQKHKLRVPIGVEKVLCKAVVDPQFEALLLDERERAIRECGFELVESERQALLLAPRSALRAMLRNIDLPRHGKRRFMGAVAGAVLAAATAGPHLACEPGAADKPDVIEMPHFDCGGIMPDIPGDTPDVIDVPHFDPGGIMPDVPEPADVAPDLVVVDDGAPMPAGILADVGPDVLEVPDVAPAGIMPDVDF